MHDTKFIWHLKKKNHTCLRLVFHLVKSLVKSKVKKKKRLNPKPKMLIWRICTYLFIVSLSPLCWPSLMIINCVPWVHFQTTRVSPYVAAAASCLIRVPKSFTRCIYFSITAGNFYSDFIVWAPLFIRGSCLLPLECGSSLIRFTAAKLTCH